MIIWRIYNLTVDSQLTLKTRLKKLVIWDNEFETRKNRIKTKSKIELTTRYALNDFYTRNRL